jgi:hypothetical protein
MEEKVTMLMLQLEESMNAKAEVEQAPSRHSMRDKKPVPRP